MHSRLTTPRAAAVAGILFSLLLIANLVLIRLSVPQNPEDAGDWLAGGWRTVTLALNLLPFAGIAFLWFIGVVRDRLGEREDRFLGADGLPVVGAPDQHAHPSGESWRSATHGHAAALIGSSLMTAPVASACAAFNTAQVGSKTKSTVGQRGVLAERVVTM